jgi:hypothetical protein
MAALQALTGGLTPPNEDLEFLQNVGIAPTTTLSTTTTPYTAAEPAVKFDPAHESILQAIQQLDTKFTNGFAQIMGKLSNTPVKTGGGEISTQDIEMQNSTMTSEPSFLNKIASGAKDLAKKTTNAVGITRQENAMASSGPQMGPQMEPTMSAHGGRRRKSRRSRRKGRKVGTKRRRH